MKLKKIASLALAGIMAVSMLTACGEGTNNSNSGSSSSEPTTTGIVSAVENSIKVVNSDLTIDVKESQFLNDQLKTLLEDHTLKSIKADNCDLITSGIENAFGLNDGTVITMPTFDRATLMGLTSGVTVTAGKDGWYYAVIDKGNVSSATAQTLAAREIAEKMADAANEVAATSSTTSNVFKYNYTMYVSQMNVTDVGDTSVPVIFVALKVSVSLKTI